MRFRIIGFFLLGFFYGTMPAVATKATTDQIAPKNSAVSHLKIQEVRAPNGVLAWLAETQEIPVISIALCFRHAGQKSDPSKKEGLAQLLAHVLSEGAGPWNKDEINEYMLERNIQLKINASKDDFFITLRTTKEYIKDGLNLLKLVLSEPIFNSSVIESTKQQMYGSLRDSLEDESHVAIENLNRIVFGNHPYSRTSNELMESLGKIEIIDLKEFIKTYFAKDNLLISVAGAISSSELTELLEKTFSGLPEKSSPAALPNVELNNLGKTYEIEMDIPQSFICFLHPGISRQDPDFYAVYILNKIIGDEMYGSRLWEEIRESRGLAYHLATELTYGDHYQLIYGMIGTKTQSVQEVLNIVKKTYQDVIESGLSEKELAFVKKRLLGEFALNFSNTASIAMALLSFQRDQLGIDYFHRRNQFINQVTLKDINRLAKQLLDINHFTFVVVGKKTLSTSRLEDASS